MNDTIDPAGWDISSFNLNPVALWAHDSSAPPIGRACNVRVEGDRLMGDIDFAASDVYGFADEIFRLVKAGYINAVSVGFVPLEYRLAKDPDRPGGIDFLRQELLEISVCSVPANANALVEQRSARTGRWRQRRFERRSLQHADPIDLRTDAERAAVAADIAWRNMPMRNLDTEAGRLERTADIRRVLKLSDPVHPHLVAAELFHRTFRW